MSLKDITLTGSIGSIATQSYGQRTYISSTDDQSFPIEHISGSDAKAWPNFVQGTNYTVNLVVNVTQSWSGSNVTPLGDVPYVHDTMEEFVNGEFSGSNYVVTDGNLNDAQCEQFLTVGTTPTNYSIFVFECLDNLINSLTTPNPGELYIYIDEQPGFYYSFKYIKIAKIDQEGNDISPSLQELRNISWIDSSFLGSITQINLEIDNITEGSNFYLYKLKTNSYASIGLGYPYPYLTDSNILDFGVYATSSWASISSGTYDIYPLTSSWLSSGSSNIDLNGINSNGVFSFSRNPNGALTYDEYIDFTNSSNAEISFYLLEQQPGLSYYNIVGLAQAGGGGTISPGTYNLNITDDYCFTKGYTYFLALFYDSSNSTTINDLRFELINAHSPQSATSSIIIEPYLSSVFRNSDCDVLMNNYSENDISEFYRRVLYNDGSTIPSNFQQIISGTAEFAEVNDYLFSADANVLPRYQGVRQSSDGVNNASTSSVIQIENTTNEYLGITQNTPPVQSLNTVVAYVDWWGGWPPERMNASGAHIKYLLNADGTVTIPNTSDIALFSNQNAFRSGERVIVSTQNEATPTNQYRNIIRGAARPTPILYNQLRDYDRPPMTFTGSIRFTDNNAYSSASVNDYTANIQPVGNSKLIQSTSWSGIFLDKIIYQGANITSELSNTNHYTISQNVIDEISNLELTANINGVTYEPGGITLYAAIYKSPGVNVLVQGNIFLPYNTSTGFTLKYSVPRTDFVLGVQYSIALYTSKLSSLTYYWGSNVSTPTSFVVSTNPLPTPAITCSNLFITSSYPNSSSFLFVTNSQAIQYYRSSQPIQQVDLTGSLFDPIILPFKFEIGDEFRFEGDETKVYAIKNVTENAYYHISSSPPIVSHSAVEIELTSQISGSGVDTSKFLVRRYVDDASMILLEGFKPTNSTGPYLIKPEFVVPELNKNLDQIVIDLTQKGLL